MQNFYRAFRDGVKDDPSGYETLKKTLGVDDMAKWQEEWEGSVGELRFR